MSRRKNTSAQYAHLMSVFTGFTELLVNLFLQYVLVFGRPAPTCAHFWAQTYIFKLSAHLISTDHTVQSDDDRTLTFLLAAGLYHQCAPLGCTGVSGAKAILPQTIWQRTFVALKIPLLTSPLRATQTQMASYLLWRCFVFKKSYMRILTLKSNTLTS